MIFDEIHSESAGTNKDISLNVFRYFRVARARLKFFPCAIVSPAVGSDTRGVGDWDEQGKTHDFLFFRRTLYINTSNDTPFLSDFNVHA